MEDADDDLEEVFEWIEGWFWTRWGKLGFGRKSVHDGCDDDDGDAWGSEKLLNLFIGAATATKRQRLSNEKEDWPGQTVRQEPDI